jgi:DNA replication protein DnaC
MLALAGGVGVGKTTAAAWLALKREDSAPGFIRAGELERRGRYDRQLAEWLVSRTSLVIDDLGAEVLDSKGVFVSLLDQEIDRSYSKRSTLVITTNLLETQVAERYGGRMWSRFNQRGAWGNCGMRDLRAEVP